MIGTTINLNPLLPGDHEQVIAKQKKACFQNS